MISSRTILCARGWLASSRMWVLIACVELLLGATAWPVAASEGVAPVAQAHADGASLVQHPSDHLRRQSPAPIDQHPASPDSDPADVPEEDGDNLDEDDEEIRPPSTGGGDPRVAFACFFGMPGGHGSCSERLHDDPDHVAPMLRLGVHRLARGQPTSPDQLTTSGESSDDEGPQPEAVETDDTDDDIDRSRARGARTPLTAIPRTSNAVRHPVPARATRVRIPAFGHFSHRHSCARRRRMTCHAARGNRRRVELPQICPPGISASRRGLVENTPALRVGSPDLRAGSAQLRLHLPLRRRDAIGGARLDIGRPQPPGRDRLTLARPRPLDGRRRVSHARASVGGVAR